MSDLDPQLALALRVAAEAKALGIDTALIGAVALAHYGYVRATVDVDFGAACDFARELSPLAARLRALGLHVDVFAPDADDPLAGMLRVRDQPDGDPVEVVNFRRGDSPGSRAIARAQPSPDGFSYVALADLVALKLYAGSRFDHEDVVRLLSEQAQLDESELRRVARESNLEPELERVLSRLA